MLKNIITNNYVRFTLLAICFICIIGLRLFQTDLFYDPFLKFFENNFQSANKPEYDSFHLYLSLSFRYFLNSFLSILIICLLFKKGNLVKFLVALYLFLFLLLIVLLFILLEVYFIDWQLVFYVRRFLIQPLLLILFIPGFYFQEMVSKK